MDSNEFEVLKDGVGAVVFGWADQGVLYTRFFDGLSAQNGRSYAARLTTLIARASAVHFFCDFGDLKHYDLLARSAFVRAFLSKRRSFASHTWLTWQGALSPAMRSLADNLGDSVTIVSDRDAFEGRLLRLAPLARKKLNSEAWMALTSQSGAAQGRTPV
jgi:hypothetical protein